MLTPAGFPDREGFRCEVTTLQVVASLPVTPCASEAADFRLLADVRRELGLPVEPPLD
ncbi:MAG TPA: hypothetical protein VNM50_10765 [Chloroflexota bacterium]|nr:hypothetical protein [Chloroflexota bacterium]